MSMVLPYTSCHHTDTIIGKEFLPVLITSGFPHCGSVPSSVYNASSMSWSILMACMEQVSG